MAHRAQLHYEYHNGAVNEKEKARLVKRIVDGGDLPSLSPLAIRLVELASNDQSSASDLAGVIEKDPALTTRLLRLVSSALFARGEEITSVSRGIVQVGFNQVRIMALSLSLRDTFRLGSAGGMDYDHFWKTSMCRALIAKDFARSVASSSLNPEDAFVGGLIQEIGMLMLFNVCPDEIKKVFPGGNIPLEEATAWEEQNLGISHRETGRLVLQRWRFPAHLVESQKYFGAPALDPDRPLICKVLELAREATEIFFGRPAQLYRLQDAAWRLLGLDGEKVNEVLAETFDEIEDLAEYLELEIDAKADVLAVMEKANQALVRINASMETSFQGLLDQVHQYDRSVSEMSEQMMQKRGEILQNTLDAVAHEIRNPLLAIGGFAKRLASRDEQGTEQEDRGRKYAEIIAQESSRLEGVLREIMEYCRDYRPVIADKDVVAVLDGVIGELREVFDREGITVVKRFPVGPLLVALDAGGIAGVLKQLFNNAIRMIDHAGGTVEVSVDAMRYPGQVCIGISDSGHRMPDDVRASVVDSNLTAKTFGAGLGLPLARKVVEAHRGRIALKTEEGQGNTVEIYLPASRSGQPSSVSNPGAFSC